MDTVNRNDCALEWSYLSSLDEKRYYYSMETYFRESMWDARVVLGAHLFPILHRIALVVFKPESLAGRRVDLILRFLADNHLTPIYFHPFTYTRHTMRELWRYQWTAASLDKMDVATRVNTSLPTLMAILRDDLEPRQLPAAVRMKTLKGAAAPELRARKTLRSVLNAPNRLITFVHTADEPADVVRELGIFYDRPTRRDILADVLNGLSGDVADRLAVALRRLEAKAPRTDFDSSGAWQRMVDRADGRAKDSLTEHREVFMSSGRIEWESLLPLCLCVGAEEWDIITVGTAAVEGDAPDLVRLIDFNEDSIERWRRSAATLLAR